MIATFLFLRILNWSVPTILFFPINTPDSEAAASFSLDGSMLYFGSNRAGGLGGWDQWQVPLQPKVDLNDDGIVDAADMCIMVDHWGTDNLLCDIGPMPWGDGIVDVEDLIVLAEHLFEEIIPIVDINADGIVDALDMCIMVDHWGTDDPLCDIGPMPWGDGIVDVEDLIVLAEHLFEEVPPVEPVE